MTEDSEDKLYRILSRVPFGTMLSIIHTVLANPLSTTAAGYSTTQAYKDNGWTRNEFHAEVKRRAN